LVKSATWHANKTAAVLSAAVRKKMRGSVSRVLSPLAGRAFIYLAPELLPGSCDLTRSDTDVSVGASRSWIGTYLVLLRVEIGRLTPAAFRRQDSSLSSIPGHRPGMVGLFSEKPGPILILRRAAVSRYAALRSSDFPPRRLPGGANARPTHKWNPLGLKSEVPFPMRFLHGD